MGRLHIDTGDTFTGRPPIRPPFPSLGGLLYAGYLFGNSPAAKALDPKAPGYGLRFDWSGNGRHLNGLGLSPRESWAIVTGTTTDTPLTPFTLTQMATGGEASVIVFASTTTTARSVSLARSQNVSPYLQLSLLPQTSSGTVAANMFDGASNGAQITNLGTDRTAINLFGGSWRFTDRTVWHSSPTTALRSAVNTTDVAVASTGTFHFGVETGTGDTGATKIYGAAFYQGYLDATQVAAVHTAFRAWHAAAGSGLVI